MNTLLIIMFGLLFLAAGLNLVGSILPHLPQ